MLRKSRVLLRKSRILLRKSRILLRKSLILLRKSWILLRKSWILLRKSRILLRKSRIPLPIECAECRRGKFRNTYTYRLIVLDRTTKALYGRPHGCQKNKQNIDSGCSCSNGIGSNTPLKKIVVNIACQWGAMATFCSHHLALPVYTLITRNTATPHGLGWPGLAWPYGSELQDSDTQTTA